MTIIIDPEYRKLVTLIPEDAPKEIHEAAKRKQELWEKYQEY